MMLFVKFAVNYDETAEIYNPFDPCYYYQDVDLQTGWNIFSLSLLPNEEDVTLFNILSPISDEVLLVLDETGSGIFKDQSDQWIDNIGQWQSSEGYLIKVNTGQTLELTTDRLIDLPLSIDLDSGWNIISYPIQSGQASNTLVTLNGSYDYYDGTSMASPVAASVAGLMKSLHPEWMVEQIHTMIVATADPVIYDVNTEAYIQGKLGSGRVDALKAITTELFPKIELVDIDVTMSDNDGEINIGDAIELTSVLFNSPEWGVAINPEINLSCSSDEINIINPTMELENIPSGEAMVNFEPMVVEFSQNINPNDYECILHFTSNQNSYVQYINAFPIIFEVNDMPVLLGDLNQDETIDILDVIISVNIILEVTEPTAYQYIASDLNSDGEINIQDIIMMINLILGMN